MELYKDNFEPNQSEIDDIINIYYATFSKDIRLKYREIIRRINKHIYRIHTINDGATIMGFSLVVYLASVKCIFIDYIAIDNKYQGRGYGRKLFDHIFAYYGLSMALECDDKLVGMYNKWGCKRLPVKYDVYENHRFNLMLRTRSKIDMHKLYGLLLQLNGGQFIHIVDDYRESVLISKYTEKINVLIRSLLRDIYLNSGISNNDDYGWQKNMT